MVHFASEAWCDLKNADDLEGELVEPIFVIELSVDVSVKVD